MAAIAYYTGGSDPFYTQEGHDRWYSYPPPYWYNGGWVYAWPWMWLDGDKSPAYLYNSWEAHILARMDVESDLTIDIAGTYDGGSRDGWIDVLIYHEGRDTLNGMLQCVITESGLYYEAPNHLDWHHHVQRDMIPTDEGTPVSLPPAETTMVNLTFAIDAAWVEEECEIVVFVQDTQMQPDSTIDVWQGGKISLPDISVQEMPGREIYAPLRLSHSPNPARSAATLSFGLPETGETRLRVFDASGREVRSFEMGRLPAGDHTFTLSRESLNVPVGTYFCRLEAGERVRTNRLTFLD
jgi:hypothetical protein